MGSDGAATGNTGIRIRGLYKIFGKRGADHIEAVRNGLGKAELLARTNHVLGLKDINLAVAPGTIQVIMGLSGSGKSTLIRHINRLIEPTAGEVLVNGRDVVRMPGKELRAFRRNTAAMVFQTFALLPHRTVLGNTVYGLELQGMPKARRTDVAMHWIERVGLAGFEDKYPNQLSGGMQQRVGLARALSNDAPILLMDEPFSALDPLIRVDMQSVLLELQKEIRKTVVFITHDLDEALRIGDRIAILRDGAIVQDGTAQEIVLHPADAYVRSFVREVNRGRVLVVDNVMRPTTEAGGGPGIPLGTRLEDAARVLSALGLASAGVTAHGVAIGTVTLADIVAAMVVRT